MKPLTNFKKFKPNKNFQPLPADKEDELYANGIFQFNITKLLAFIKVNSNDFLQEEMEVRALRMSYSNSLNEYTVQTANLSTPIVLAEISPGKFNVIDGNHRLEKAHRNGADKISVYRVFAAQHLPFLTSQTAYNAFIGYWNSKIDDGTGCK